MWSYLVAEAGASLLMWFEVMVLQAQASMFFTTTHFLRMHLPLFAICIAKSTHHLDIVEIFLIKSYVTVMLC